MDHCFARLFQYLRVSTKRASGMKSWCEAGATLRDTERLVSPRRRASGPGTIERETPYCYGVKSLGGKSVALDKFTFELVGDCEARTRCARIWPAPGFVMVGAPDEPTLCS